MSFEAITKFENKIADFFGSPYAVATDSCTHGIEVCLRYFNAQSINCPKRTYISVPFLAKKMGLNLGWRDENWTDYYTVNEDHKIIDAAVLWKRNSYIPNTFMSLSFQSHKHLSLGRSGMILTDNQKIAVELKKMSYDRRDPMTPETAVLGLQKLPAAIATPPKQWVIEDWPDLTKLAIFGAAGSRYKSLREWVKPMTSLIGDP